MNLLDKVILERTDRERPPKRPVNERLDRSKECALCLYFTASVREFCVSAFNHPLEEFIYLMNWDLSFDMLMVR